MLTIWYDVIDSVHAYTDKICAALRDARDKSREFTRDSLAAYASCWTHVYVGCEQRAERSTYHDIVTSTVVLCAIASALASSGEKREREKEKEACGREREKEAWERERKQESERAIDAEGGKTFLDGLRACEESLSATGSRAKTINYLVPDKWIGLSRAAQIQQTLLAANVCRNSNFRRSQPIDNRSRARLPHIPVFLTHREHSRTASTRISSFGFSIFIRLKRNNSIWCFWFTHSIEGGQCAKRTRLARIIRNTFDSCAIAYAYAVMTVAAAVRVMIVWVCSGNASSSLLLRYV